MNTESGNGIVGLAIIAMLAVIVTSFAMSLLSFFSHGLLLPAAAFMSISGIASGFLLKFCFERNTK